MFSLCQDEASLTDGRQSNGSNHEKDSGISRTTDSEPEYTLGLLGEGGVASPSPPMPPNDPPPRIPPQLSSNMMAIDLASPMSCSSDQKTLQPSSSSVVTTPASELPTFGRKLCR